MSTPSFYYERKLWKQGYKVVIGADEVGRGAFAGPVVATAVAFAPHTTHNTRHTTNDVKIDDSKKLMPRQREKAAAWIKENALCWGVGEAPVSVINRLGMAKATRMAFRRAISNVSKADKSINKFVSREIKPDFLLVDAFYLPYTRGLRRKNQLAIVNGDEKSVSIAAASILAKVHRDGLMRKLSKKHPSYGWGKNKGYGTKEHQLAIERHGATRLHRRSFISKIENRGLKIEARS